MNEDVISENVSAQHIATGDDSYNCNQCDFSSVHARALRIHMKIHTMGKTNRCNQCDYATVQAGNLRRHLKAHSGEKLKNALNVILHLFMRVL